MTGCVFRSLSIASVVLVSTILAHALVPAKSHSQLTMFWVQRLSDDDDELRNEAAAQLMERVWQIVDSESHGPPDAIDVISKTRPPKEIVSIARLRRELICAQPALERVLDNGKLGGASLSAAMCLAVIKRDGATLLSASPNTLSELAVIQSLASVTLRTMPRDRDVFSTILKRVGALSPKSKNYLEAQWMQLERDDKHYGWGANFVHLPYTLIKSDRTILELDQLIKGIGSQYPNLLRIIIIEALAELGPEVRRATPALRCILKDKSHRIRLATALAIVSIERDKSEVRKLSEDAALEPVARKAFVAWTDGKFQAWDAQKDVFQGDSAQDRAVAKAFLQFLDSKNGYYRRQAIRAIGQMGRQGRFAEANIRMLTLDDDEETRIAAKQSLELILPESPKD